MVDGSNAMVIVGVVDGSNAMVIVGVWLMEVMLW